VYKTSSLSTNHVSLQLAVESQSHLFIEVAPGGPRNPRSLVLVRVSLLPTGVRAVVGATVQLTGVGAVVGATVQLGAMDITAGAARPLGARSEMTFRRPFKRVGFYSHPTPRFHTNNVSVPEQGDDAAVRQIVQANSASPHFVGAITSAKGKELVESPPTVNRKQLAAESDAIS
jgi:hypothetical protein